MDHVNDDLRDLYQDLILDHSKHPRNFRVLDGSNREALGHNPLCGDRLMLYLTVGDGDVIQDVAFQGNGCAISMASASMMTEMLKGKTVADARHLFDYMHQACTGKPAAVAVASDAPAAVAEQSRFHIDEDDADRLQALAGVRQYPIRVKCATLAWHTLTAALQNERRASTE